MFCVLCCSKSSLTWGEGGREEGAWLQVMVSMSTQSQRKSFPFQKWGTQTAWQQTGPTSLKFLDTCFPMSVSLGIVSYLGIPLLIHKTSFIPVTCLVATAFRTIRPFLFPFLHFISRHISESPRSSVYGYHFMCFPELVGWPNGVRVVSGGRDKKEQRGEREKDKLSDSLPRVEWRFPHAQQVQKWGESPGRESNHWGDRMGVNEQITVII